MTSQSIAIRAQELINRQTADGLKITGEEATRRAIDELCGGDYQRAVQIAAGSSMGWAKSAKRANHELPEQESLFAIPDVIVVEDAGGDLWMPRNEATVAQVMAWGRVGEQYHGSQHRRFKSLNRKLEAAELDPAGNFDDQVHAIGPVL